MTNLVIHVGFPKTATTTFQKNIIPSCNNLVNINPDTDCYELTRGILLSRELTFKREISSIIKPIKDLINQHDSNTKFILSSESFLSYSLFFVRSPEPFVHSPDPSSIARKLKIFCQQNLFDNVQILIGIRRQDELLKSLYAQMYNRVFKNYRKTETFQKYLSNFLFNSEFNYLADALFYDEIINEYQNNFGYKNVSILVYEELKNGHPNYISKLSSLFEIDEFKLKQLFSLNNDNKKSFEKYYSTDSISIYNFLNRIRILALGDSSLRKFNKFKNMASKLNKLKFQQAPIDLKLDCESLKKIKKMFSKTNKNLDERMSLNLKAYNYY